MRKQEKCKRVLIPVSDEIYERVKARAVRNGRCVGREALDLIQGYLDRLDDRVEMRVEVPSDVADALSAMAERQNVSVAELCEQLVTNATR